MTAGTGCQNQQNSCLAGAARPSLALRTISLRSISLPAGQCIRRGGSIHRASLSTADARELKQNMQ